MGYSGITVNHSNAFEDGGDPMLGGFVLLILWASGVFSMSFSRILINFSSFSSFSSFDQLDIVLSNFSKLREKCKRNLWSDGKPLPSRLYLIFRTQCCGSEHPPKVDLEGYQRAWRLRHAADDGLMLQVKSDDFKVDVKK